jgi:hypothetical protein
MAKGPFGGIGSFVRKNHSLPIVGSLQLPLNASLVAQKWRQRREFGPTTAGDL